MSIFQISGYSIFIQFHIRISNEYEYGQFIESSTYIAVIALFNLFTRLQNEVSKSRAVGRMFCVGGRGRRLHIHIHWDHIRMTEYHSCQHFIQYPDFTYIHWKLYLPLGMSHVNGPDGWMMAMTTTARVRTAVATLMDSLRRPSWTCKTCGACKS